jgi:hypothetical protein
MACARRWVHDFPEENGAVDSELHYALERIFGTSLALTGMILEGAPVEYLTPPRAGR